LEASWDNENLTDRASVLPTLELLERMGEIDFVHRDIGTRAELEYYLERWLNEGLPYYVLYLAAHGSDGDLLLSNRDGGRVSLDFLGGQLADQLDGCVVYLASCSILSTEEERVRRFMKQTGARAVIGYTKDVDWTESAAMDLLVLSALAQYQQLERGLKRLESSRYRSLTRELGFEVVRR
jgi:hypothetical protein